jgi:hypothetical protein
MRVSAARERTPEEPNELPRVHEPDTGVETSGARGRTVPVAVAVVVVAVEAVWLIGVAYLVFRLVTLV